MVVYDGDRKKFILFLFFGYTIIINAEASKANDLEIVLYKGR